MSLDEPLKTNAFVPVSPKQGSGWSAGAGALDVERVGRSLRIDVAGDGRAREVDRGAAGGHRPSRTGPSVSLMVKTSVLPGPDSPLMVTVPPLPVNASVPPPAIKPDRTAAQGDTQAGVVAVRAHGVLLAGGGEEDEVIGGDDVGVAQPGAEVDVADGLCAGAAGIARAGRAGAASPPVGGSGDRAVRLVVLHAHSVPAKLSFVAGERRGVACTRADHDAGGRADRAVGDRHAAAVLDGDTHIEVGGGEARGGQ